ncbi:MAG: dienelactone hydrolase family protein [Planctomyces sp.]|nr:dienelactone hydrolase family protein [Planctomyces sp.]
MPLSTLLRLLTVGLSLNLAAVAATADEAPRPRTDPQPIVSSWDDLTEGLATREDWEARRGTLRARYLELLRDQHKPERPPTALEVHESAIVDGLYERRLISYAVESDERCHAYLGIPLNREGPLPAIVALHGTTDRGKEQTAGLDGDPDKAFLDHLCRRGYVVIAPDHFVAGHRIPPEGSYETARFQAKHPEWTAVGKFTFEHSIAVDVLQSLAEVDPAKIGALGHSLGGHGSMFLAAYDERVQAACGNCSAAFFRQNRQALEWSRDRWYVYFKPLREGLLRGELPPIDFHEIMALAAPRAYLDVSGLNDGDRLTQRQRLLMLGKVADVYELVGAPENFAFFVHGRGHAAPHESRAVMYAFLDAQLQPAGAIATRRVEGE